MMYRPSALVATLSAEPTRKTRTSLSGSLVPSAITRPLMDACCCCASERLGMAVIAAINVARATRDHRQVEESARITLGGVGETAGAPGQTGSRRVHNNNAGQEGPRHTRFVSLRLTSAR